jgi:hypothetical protein
MKLLIITVHKGPVHKLLNSLDSIDQQSCLPELNVVVSPFIDEEIQRLYSRSYRKFVIGKDNSLYHAMNIGLEFSKDFNTFFLNSGDVLFSHDSIDYVKKYCKDNVVNIFETVLKTKNYIFYPKRKFISHSSFVRPPDLNPILFNESFSIVADGPWMKSNIDRFFYYHHNRYISIFTLDGISSLPSFASVVSKWEYRPLESLKEFVKLLLFNLMFKKDIYFLIIFFLKYDIKKI